MKKLFVLITAMLIVFSLFGCSKNKQEEQPVGPQYTVTINLECEENLLLSRYDMDVYVDDEEIGNLEHGGSQAFQVKVGEGSHTLKATEEGNTSVDGSIGFTVSADTELHYLLTCSKDQIKITDLSETDSGGAEEKEEQEVSEQEVSNQEEVTPEKEEQNKTYESILAEYTQKLQEATPGLIEEYKAEAKKNENGLEGLAELSNKKVEKLAEISNAGVEEMAEIMWTTGSGNYEEYEDWSSKLYDVYMEEAEKITDAYMESAM